MKGGFIELTGGPLIFIPEDPLYLRPWDMIGVGINKMGQKPSGFSLGTYRQILYQRQGSSQELSNTIFCLE